MKKMKKTNKKQAQRRQGNYHYQKKKLCDLGLRYYHITRPEHVESILKNGLKSDVQGNIFIFRHGMTAKNGVVNFVDDCIAEEQVFFDKYARIEIDPAGINVELVRDNVGESSRNFQWIVKQPSIRPEYLRLDVIKENGFKPWFQFNYDDVIRVY